MYGVKHIPSVPIQLTFWTVGMYFETFILTNLFKNAKSKTTTTTATKKKKKKKKHPKFSKILGRSEKGKQTFF